MTLWELSHAQKRIWYAQQKYPGSPLFSIGGMAIGGKRAGDIHTGECDCPAGPDTAGA